MAMREVILRMPDEDVRAADARAAEMAASTGLRCSRADIIRQALRSFLRVETPAANDGQPAPAAPTTPPVPTKRRKPTPEDRQAAAALEIGESVLTTGKPVSDIAEPRAFAPSEEEPNVVPDPFG